jgi:hypothetical protein
VRSGLSFDWSSQRDIGESLPIVTSINPNILSLDIAREGGASEDYPGNLVDSDNPGILYSRLHLRQ